MKDSHFDAEEVLHKLQHYLPAQAPLKDFVHHNTLHAFQHLNFFDALRQASAVFGYKTTLSLSEYRERYRDGQIAAQIIWQVIGREKGADQVSKWYDLMLEMPRIDQRTQRIGELRRFWKKALKVDLDTLVHLNLFKMVGSYLDQGIAIQKHPSPHKGFLSAIQEIEENSFFEQFHSKRVRDLLFKKNKSIEELLQILVGDEAYYEQYLFDQQFAHPGWSGIVAVIEGRPQTLLDKRKITLFDFVYLELLLEIDALDKIKPKGWKPIAQLTDMPPMDLMAEEPLTEYWEVIRLWQLSLEQDYYDQVLAGMKLAPVENSAAKEPSFQAFFCIDDREESLRRHIERVAPNCQTFGTPAHFSLEIMYQPEHGKFYTQVCPAPLSPTHLIKEANRKKKRKTSMHFQKHSHNLFTGWLISQTMFFWYASKLFLNIFRPEINPAHSSSFEHMDEEAELVIENTHGESEKGYQIGFTVPEMAVIVRNQLSSVGLKDGFATLIYFIGHGGSSTNNPYYAGYNCGACAGRPSSVNARVFANIANRADVRERLKAEGIDIPESTQFLGGLHDTTRDEFMFYDEKRLNQENATKHYQNKSLFVEALNNNAKERARQFISIDIHQKSSKIHDEVRLRSVALFEPRPELNHSNNALCIVGNRKITQNLFLDQRAFLNSYDYRQDPSGTTLSGILNAATPVCGGINLEYYFSRVDNESFGAGSKLPHNVVGLFGVANGIEGDLRTGLPSQMIEVHEPLRLMMVVEQDPGVVEATIKKNPRTYEWYEKGWLKLAVLDPQSHETYMFLDGRMQLYHPLVTPQKVSGDFLKLLESSSENLPVYQLA